MREVKKEPERLQKEHGHMSKEVMKGFWGWRFDNWTVNAILPPCSEGYNSIRTEAKQFFNVLKNEEEKFGHPPTDKHTEKLSLPSQPPLTRSCYSKLF